MKASLVEITKRYIAIVLVSIIGLVTLNNILFVHVHKLSNGMLVVHAHPFSKSTEATSNQTHQHSKIEFSFIDSLLLLFASSIATFAVLALSSKHVLHFRPNPQVSSFLPQRLTNKAPPVLV
jgi:hypothetical protein